MNNNLSIITFNVNGLNALIKRHRIAEWIRNMTHTYAAYKRPTSGQNTYTTKSEGLETNFSSKWTGKKKPV